MNDGEPRIRTKLMKSKRKPHKIMMPKVDNPSEEELVRFEKYMNLMFEDIFGGDVK